MRAYVLTGFDAPPRLAEVPEPAVGAQDVLVRVLATSVNPVDALVASGFFRTAAEHRFPAVFGRDVCGEVVAVGGAVTRFAVGDVVWGFVKRDHVGGGTFAELVACPQDRFVVAKPTGLSVVEAGSAGLAAVTALECLDALDLRAGDTVFVNRATGGVGSFAVQIAAARGLRVLATARPGAARAHVLAMGAHEVVDWTAGDVARQVREVAPDGVAGVVDLVRRDTSAVLGEDESASRAAVTELVTAVLRPGGRFSSVTNGAAPELLRDGTGTNVHSEPTAANLEAVGALVDAGSVRGCVTATFDLDHVADAFEHQAAHGLGKTAVVVDPRPPAGTRTDAGHPPPHRGHRGPRPIGE